jgi:hypothetical protein
MAAPFFFLFFFFFFDEHVEQLFRHAIEEECPMTGESQNVQSTGVPGHWEIAHSLINYLSSKIVIESCKALQEKEPWEQPEGTVFSLVRYAVQFWPTHYRKLRPDKRHVTDIFQALECWPFLYNWSKLRSLFGNTDHPFDKFTFDPLYLAALHGLEDLVRHIGPTEEKITRETAIALASWGGHANIVELLLEAYPNQTELDLSAGIENASVRGHDDIVRVLLKKVDKSSFHWHGNLLGRAAELDIPTRCRSLLPLVRELSLIKHTVKPLHSSLQLDMAMFPLLTIYYLVAPTWIPRMQTIRKTPFSPHHAMGIFKW